MAVLDRGVSSAQSPNRLLELLTTNPLVESKRSPAHWFDNVYRVQEARGMFVVQWTVQCKSYTVVNLNTAYVCLSCHPLS